MAEQGVLGTVTIQLGLRHERRPGAIDRDMMVFRSLPRRCDRRSQIRREGSALDECFPRHPHLSLVHPGSSEVTTSATRVSRGRAIDHLDVGSPVKITVSMTQKAHIDRTAVHLSGGPIPGSILNIVRRSRHDDYGVIRSNNLSRVHFPDSAGVSFVSPIWRKHTLLVGVLQKETGGTRTMFHQVSPRCNPKAGGCRIQGRTAMGRPGGFGQAPDRRYFVRYRDVVRFR